MQDNIELFKGQFWRINQNISFGIPGYLFLQSLRDDVGCFSQLSIEEAAEMGVLLQRASTALESVLQPKLVLVGRYGLVPGHMIHFHLMPLFDELFDRYKERPEYQAFQRNNPQDYPAVPDAAELMAFAWREYCWQGKPLFDPPIEEVPKRLAEFLVA